MPELHTFMASSRRPRRALWLGLLAAASLSGCVESSDRPATWSYVYATIIAPSCATSSCHSSLAATAGIQLHSKEAGYTFLTGRLCGESSEASAVADHNFVDPGHPESSKLMYLLWGIEVRRMPPDAPLADSEIELVERWILEGAQCN